MKIAFLFHDRPNYTGGPTINALRLLPEFAKRGHDVLAVVGYSQDYPNARTLQKFGIKLRTYKHGYAEDNVYKILGCLKAFQPDIFVPNYLAAGGYAGYWAKQAGIPTIITHRSDDQRNWCTARTFALKNWKWRCSALVCVSEYLRQESLKEPGFEKESVHMEVIPSGVPVPTFKAKQTTGTPLRVIYAGRFVQKQKRIWETVEAFIQLSKKYKDLHFTLIGDGEEREKLVTYVRQVGLASRIRFEARTEGKAYHNILAQHNIIVLLSDYEGMPGSIMDGMACGLVPVVYDFKGIRELVIPEKTGLVVSDRDQNFEKALVTLMQYPEAREQMAKDARNHVIQNFSLESATNKWISLFSRLKRNTKRSSITIPEYLDLPSVPECYHSLGDDIRVPQREQTPSTLSDNFIHIPFTLDNLDRYWVRTSILRALKKSLVYFQGNFLDVGCGKMPYRDLITSESKVTEYTGLDIDTALVYHTAVQPDFTWDGEQMPFEDNTFNSGMATEVLEHCPDPVKVLREVHRVLKPRSTFFFTVPYLWTLHEVPYDEYRYTPFALERIVREAGFTKVQVFSLGGWNAAMAQMLGLWVRRSPLPNYLRSLLSPLVFVAMKLLLRYEYFGTTFSAGTMHTGFYGILKK